MFTWCTQHRQALSGDHKEGKGIRASCKWARHGTQGHRYCCLNSRTAALGCSPHIQMWLLQRDLDNQPSNIRSILWSNRQDSLSLRVSSAARCVSVCSTQRKACCDLAFLRWAIDIQLHTCNFVPVLLVENCHKIVDVLAYTESPLHRLCDCSTSCRPFQNKLFLYHEHSNNLHCPIWCKQLHQISVVEFPIHHPPAFASWTGYLQPSFHSTRPVHHCCLQQEGLCNRNQMSYITFITY